MSDHDPYGDPTRADIPVTDLDDPTMAMPAATGAPPPVGPPPTGRPPAEPPDRRPWIIGGLLALLLLVGLAIVLLAGGDDDGTAADATTTSTTAAPDTTTTTEGTTTTAAPTTTTTAPTTTTTSPPTTVAPGLCVSSAPDDPETTAQVVFQAFTLDDRDCAGNLMTSDALDQLFGLPGRGQGWSFAGCFDQEEPDPHTQCSYTYEGGATNFQMSYSETDGWTVYDVSQVAD